MFYALQVVSVLLLAAPIATAVLLFLMSPGGVRSWLTLAARLAATEP